MEHVRIRPAEPRDIAETSKLFHDLWPEGTLEEHARELVTLVAGDFPGTLPGIVFVAIDPDGRVIGFIEVDLRSHADGCDPARPTAFLEGWYVATAWRRKRVGAKLVAAAEEWARNQGCTEIASDTWWDALDSQRAHERLGFEVVDRCVHYRKNL